MRVLLRVLGWARVKQERVAVVLVSLSLDVRVGAFFLSRVYNWDRVLKLLKVMEVVVGMVGFPVRIQTRTLFLPPLLLLLLLPLLACQESEGQRHKEAEASPDGGLMIATLRMLELYCRRLDAATTRKPLGLMEDLLLLINSSPW